MLLVTAPMAKSIPDPLKEFISRPIQAATAVVMDTGFVRTASLITEFGRRESEVNMMYLT